MESWEQNRHRGSRRHVGIRTRRRLRQCGWCVSCVPKPGNVTGAVKRVAEQLGYGVESVRSWVNRADIDEGIRPGTTSQDGTRIKELEQECVSCVAPMRS